MPLNCYHELSALWYRKENKSNATSINLIAVHQNDDVNNLLLNTTKWLVLVLKYISLEKVLK